MADTARELAPEELKWSCDREQFDFSTTEELPELDGLIGQQRATEALEFGVRIDRYGYNVFVMGPRGAGKSTAVRSVLETHAAELPTPSDWCYVHNFEDPKCPNALELPAGRAKALAADMKEIVAELATQIPRAFEGENYQRQRNEITQDFQSKRREIFEALQVKAQERNFGLKFSPQGIAVVPMIDGQPVDPEKYEALPPEKRTEIEEQGHALHDELNEATKRIRTLEKEMRHRISELDANLAKFAVGDVVADLKRKYCDLADVCAYLDRVENDLVGHVHDFVNPAPPEGQDEAAAALMGLARPSPSFERYVVNVIVDHSGSKGAPVVLETNPTFYNLLGRLEYKALMGGMTTDFTRIRAGALHRANGGFLVVQAKDVLMNPFAWEALKRALKTQEIELEDMNEQFRLVNVERLETQPIPLSVKIILIGSPRLYYLMYALDEDFQKLFKVKSHFDLQTGREAETVAKYARYIGVLCRSEDLLHFVPDAVAAVIERGARVVDSQEKLATTFSELGDLVREADFWARRAGGTTVEGSHVRKALDELRHRNDLVQERVQELIEKDTLMVDVAGAKVGQVNGLAVSDMGEYRFARPSRITATTYMGSAGVVNIEREVKMSGSIHDKGVLILSGFLGARYARKHPLSLSANICFEQSYSDIDGDSASSTELYALLSSLSGVPLKQGIAVTGSVNQHGEIQPIGAATTKIEGFFEICKRKGLTGKQGVLIPARNVRHLMLEDNVIDAVREGRFHIWAADTIDQGIELLTGKPAGELRKDDTYPPKSINGLVRKKLAGLAKGIRQFAKGAPAPRTGGKGKKKTRRAGQKDPHGAQ